MRNFFSKYNFVLIVLLTTFLFPTGIKAGTFVSTQVKTVFDNENLLVILDISDTIDIKKITFYQAEQAMAELKVLDTGENRMFFPFLAGANTVEIKIQYKDGSVNWKVISLGEVLYRTTYKKYNIPRSDRRHIFPLVHLLHINPLIPGKVKKQYIDDALKRIEKRGKYETVLENLFKEHPGFYLEWLVKHETILGGSTGKILTEHYRGIIKDKKEARENFFKAFVLLIQQRIKLGLKLLQLKKEKNHALDTRILKEIKTLNGREPPQLLSSLARLCYSSREKSDPTGFYYNYGYYFLRKAILLARDNKLIERIIDHLDALVKDLENTGRLKEILHNSNRKRTEEVTIYSYTYNIILEDLAKILEKIHDKKPREKLAWLVIDMALSEKVANGLLAGKIYRHHLYDGTKSGHPYFFYDWLEESGNKKLAKKDYAGAWEDYKIIHKHGKAAYRGEIFLINTFQDLFMLQECSKLNELYTRHRTRLSPGYREISRGIDNACRDEDAVKRYFARHLAVKLENRGSNQRNFKREPYLMHLINATFRTPGVREPLRKQRTNTLDDEVDKMLSDFIDSTVNCRLTVQPGHFSDKEKKLYKETLPAEMKKKYKVRFTRESPQVEIRIAKNVNTGYIEICFAYQLNKKLYFAHLQPTGTGSLIEEAVDLLGYWLADIKNDITLSFEKAATFAVQENWEKALIEYKKLYNHFNDSTFLRGKLVELYTRLSIQHRDTHPDEAIKFIRQGIELLEAGTGPEAKEEKLKESKLKLAGLYRDCRRFQQAIRIYRELSMTFPTDRSIIREYMFSYPAIDRELARQLLFRLLRDSESFTPIEDIYMASIYTQLGNCREARIHAERAYINDVGEDCRINYLYGKILMDCGSVVEALEVLKEGIRNDHKYHPAHHLYGEILLQMGKWDEAIRAFQKSKNLTFAPHEHAGDCRSIGIAHLLKRNLTTGIESIEKSIDLYSNLSEQHPTSYYYKIGKLYGYAVTADLEKISEIYGLIEADKNIPAKIMGQVEYYMANAYLLNNRAQESKAHLEQATAYDSSESLYYYQMALINDLYSPEQRNVYLIRALESDDRGPTFDAGHLISFPLEYKNYLAALAAEQGKDMKKAQELWDQLEADIDRKIKEYDGYLENQNDKTKKEVISKYKTHYLQLKKRVAHHRNAITMEVNSNV